MSMVSEAGHKRGSRRWTGHVLERDFWTASESRGQASYLPRIIRQAIRGKHGNLAQPTPSLMCIARFSAMATPDRIGDLPHHINFNPN